MVLVTYDGPTKKFTCVIYILFSRTCTMVMSCSAFGCQNRFNKESNIRCPRPCSDVSTFCKDVYHFQHPRKTDSICFIMRSKEGVDVGSTNQHPVRYINTKDLGIHYPVLEAPPEHITISFLSILSGCSVSDNLGEDVYWHREYDGAVALC